MRLAITSYNNSALFLLLYEPIGGYDRTYCDSLGLDFRLEVHAVGLWPDCSLILEPCRFLFLGVFRVMLLVNSDWIFLFDLCLWVTWADDGGLSSDEELSGGEAEQADSSTRSEDRELKDKLFRKYGSHIGSLKLEFSKKKKKGKLPKEARQALLEWWNSHYKWPYPTEADKISLAKSTGLDQKQINNWFINQRKRHWKPSEQMQLAVMDSLSGQFFTDD